MIRLHDTASSQVVPLHLREEGKVSMYVCGPTVYAPPHIGHGRMGLVYDLYRRFLISTGLEVTFVSNITDIDDSIINTAAETGTDWREFARHWEEVWWQGMDTLNILRPDTSPRATDYVEQMIELIGRFIDSDQAYKTSDGVYLSIEGIDDYGLLAHQSLEDLLEGGGERETFSEEKRHPADFALWKFAKPGEPSWETPWGAGRPGWHTECVVMSLDLLGEGFDLHAGGMDLKFPHHENERAQAVADGSAFAGHWMHNGFVEFGGEKMSKSLGNVMNLLELAEKYDPRCYRLIVLQAHYRSPIEVTDTTLANAEAALGRLDSFARRTADLVGEPTAEVMAEVTARLSDDFDTPGATDIFFRQVRLANSEMDAGNTAEAGAAAATARAIADIFGLEMARSSEDIPADVARLVEERTRARASKDWARADEIRDELAALGWAVEDSADGPKAHRA